MKTLPIVVLYFLLSLSVAGAQTRQYIFLSADEIASARTGGTATTEQEILRRTLLARAEEALNTPLRYTVPGHPDQVLPEYVPWPVDRDSEMLLIRKDAADTDALAVAYAITGDRRYAGKAWENVRGMLATYKAFGSYHPHRENNDLAAAHAFMALATTWDLCAAAAPEDVKELVLTEGVRRARFMYNTAVSDWKLNGLPVPFSTPGVPEEARPCNRNIFAMLTTNHCWVDVALLGCLALALESEDVSAAGEGSTPRDWLRFAVHFFKYIAGIMPGDGSYPESRVYGAPYAFEGSTPFFRALKRARGIDLFALNPFFHNFAYGRMYAVWDHPGHGGIANFGEGWGHEWHSAAWIYAVAAAYRDPVLQWSANCWTRFKPSTDETAWQYLAYDPSLAETHPDSAGFPHSIILSDVAHIHVHGGPDPWGKAATQLSFRGTIAGRNQYVQHDAGKLPYIQTWHMHQSRNAFELIVGGSPLIWRDTDYADGTGNYSVLEVDGNNQVRPDAPLPGVTDFEATDKYVTFSSEIGAAYPELDTYLRRVVCVEPGIFVIADWAHAREPNDIHLKLHFGGGTAAMLTQSDDIYNKYVVTGSHEGVPFSCALLRNAHEVDWEVTLSKAATENASQTLRYGLPAGYYGVEALVVIRTGGNVEPARLLQPTTDGMLTAFVPDPERPVMVVAASGSPHEVTYLAPDLEVPVRHLVTGLEKSGGYELLRAVGPETKYGRSVYIVISKGDEAVASSQGTLMFDVYSSRYNYRVEPVSANPVEPVQQITARMRGAGN